MRRNATVERSFTTRNYGLAQSAADYLRTSQSPAMPRNVVVTGLPGVGGISPCATIAGSITSRTMCRRESRL